MNHFAYTIAAMMLLSASVFADTQKPCLLHENDIKEIRHGNIEWVKTKALEDYDGTKRYKCIDGNRTGASMIHYTIYHQHKEIFEWLVANTSDGWNTKTRPWPASMNDPITSTCDLATTVKNNAKGAVDHIVKLKADLLKAYGYQLRDVDGTEEKAKREKFALAEDIYELACEVNKPSPPPVCPAPPADDSDLELVSEPWGNGWHKLDLVYDSIHFFGAKGKQVKFHCAPDFGDSVHINSEDECSDLIIYPSPSDDKRVRAYCPIGEMYLDMPHGSSRLIHFRTIFGHHDVPSYTACTLLSDAPFGLTIR